MAISRVRWSFSTCRASKWAFTCANNNQMQLLLHWKRKWAILFFSPLDWFGSRESSPSPLRPLVGELALLVSVKRKGLVKQKKVLTKCSKNIFCCLLSLCLFFSSCSTNQPGLLLSRDNSISGNIALLLFNCLCLQWQPFVVSFIYPTSVLLDSFCSKLLRECIQDPTSPPLD